jgi:hypothetical protein
MSSVARRPRKQSGEDTAAQVHRRLEVNLKPNRDISGVNQNFVAPHRREPAGIRHASRMVSARRRRRGAKNMFKDCRVHLY